MAKWSENGTKINKTDGDWDLNNGKKFEPTDGIRASDINKVVESTIYTQITSDEAKDIANHAKEVAESIQGIAENAVDIAENAVDIAESAVNTATNAVTTAEEAKDMAQEAKDAVAQGMGTIVMENNEPLLVFDADKKMDKTPKEPKVVSDAFSTRITATNDVEIIDSPLSTKTATIKSIKGVTIKAVQKNGNFVSTSNWLGGFGLSASNNTLTCKVLSLQDLALQNDIALMAGHTYYVSVYIKAKYANTTRLGIYSLDGTPIDQTNFNPTANRWEHLTAILSAYTDSAYIRLYHNCSYGYAVNDTIEVRDFRIVDLSESSVEHWTKTKLDGHIPHLDYWEGFYNSEISQLKSIGDNLIKFIPKTLSQYGVTTRVDADGTITVNGTATGNTDRTIFGDGLAGNIILKRPVTELQLVVEHISGTIGGASLYVMADGRLVNDGTTTYGQQISCSIPVGSTGGIYKSYVVNDRPGFLHNIRLYIGQGLTFNNLKLRVMLLHKDNPLTEYKPYTEHVLELPQYELPKLLNGVADEIDLTNKTYIKRVGKIVIDGSQEVAQYQGDVGGTGTYAFSVTIPNYKNKSNADYVPNILADRLRTLGGETVWNKTYPCVAPNTNGRIVVRDYFPSYAVADAKAYLAQNPITLWFELDEPIIEPLDKDYDATYPAWNYGLEQVFDADGNPTIAQTEIEYPLDLQKQVDTNTWIAQKNEDRISQVANIRNDLTSGNLVVKIAQYASSDTEKGTIEERLTNLGFKSGSVSLSISGYGSMGSAALTRQGNYVIVKLNIQNANLDNTPSGTIGTLPPNFRPVTSEVYRIGGLGRLRLGAPVYQVSCRYDLTISSSGVMSITAPLTTTGSPPADTRCSLHQTGVSIGFRAPPITT